MKKTYIIPQTIEVRIDEFELIAQSPRVGPNTGNKVGMQQATDDDDDNFFVKSQNNTWDNEW